MQAQDIVTFFRTLMAEPFQNRWSDVAPTPAVPVYNSTLVLASQAQREVARETRWFEGRYAINTQGAPHPVQEYGLPDIVSIRRVYMMTPTGPQRLPFTSIPLMEGDQIRLYDQTAANYVSQWRSLPGASYPVANGQGGPGYSALPMFPGFRPSYYRNGNNIGIVPCPTGSYTIVIDVFDMPKEFAALTDASPFPTDWKEIIAWYMCHLAYFSDQSEGADSLAAAALTHYERALAKQLSWVSNIDEGDPQGPQILTHRTFYGAGTTGGYD